MANATTVRMSPAENEMRPPGRESGVHQRPRQAAGHDQPSQSPGGITRLSPATHESGPHHIQRWDVLPQHGFPQHHNHGQAIVAAPGSADALGRNLVPQQSGRRDEQLALLAHVLQSDSLQNSPSVATSRIPLAGHSVSKDTGLQNSVAQPVGVGEQSGSYGTLMLGKGGRSKYLGPTAGSEWLKESETQDISDSPPVTRAPSPKITQEPVRSQPGRLTPGTAPIAFPFNVAASHISTRELLSRLPPREEAETLVASYYRYCAWHHDVAPRATFDKTFDRVYASSSGTSLSPKVNPQEIALVFIILAQGTMFNIEMPNYDPSTEDWLHLSELALVKGRFLSNNMVAGLQTLAAIEASPEPSPRSMTISFQQSNLALNISETIINLHRPYYAKALYDINERTKSIYAPSFLTVIERCGIIIAIVDDIHTRFPAVSTRQWNFWYHVFGSALCLGTLVLRDPQNSMATFALTQVDAAINLFTSLVQHGANTPRYCRNLQWLSKLRARASSKIATVFTATQQVDSQRDQVDPDGQEIGREDREDSEDVELLGWRTRLIERAGQGRPTIRTIQLAETPTDSYESLDVSNASPHGHPQGELGTGDNIMMPGSSLPMVTPDSTNELLQDFWDPMLLQDILGGIPVE
ncbi:hypothetical protein CBS11852_10088 [Aspergillus niger]|nr:hypothetical protein CBS11350_9770 [Aspergillus niger]KAI2879059.1 hypothetical protein CBS11852_10088 [Aspergillus niger]